MRDRALVPGVAIVRVCRERSSPAAGLVGGVAGREAGTGAGGPTMTDSRACLQVAGLLDCAP